MVSVFPLSGGCLPTRNVEFALMVVRILFNPGQNGETIALG
jgi:hypothetical protein